MSESGKVIGLSDGPGLGVVTVRMTRSAACGKCGACRAGDGEAEMLVDAVNACGAAIGDEVSIELTSGNFLKAALIMYGLPCAGFMAGIALGYAAAWSLGDARALAAFASGVAGAALAYAYITRAHKNWRVAETKPVAVNIQRKTPQ